MKSSTLFVLLSFAFSALAASTPLARRRLDIGGAHGNFVPAKLQHRSGSGLEKRHKRRSGKKRSCSPATSASAAAITTAAATTQAATTQAATTQANSSVMVKQNVKSASSTAQAAQASSSSSSSSTADLSSSGVTSFTGTNTGYGSWFRTDNSEDSTNGRSWCQLNYEDTWLGFAPDVSIMLANFGDSITEAGTAYCGLEAKATNPNNGNTALIYIVDGFDPTWVKTPGSIDLTIGAFKALYGSETSDKDIVIDNLEWVLTGNRNSDYAFNAGS